MGLLGLLGPGRAAAGEPVDVVVPDEDNLQFMSFWVALGAGLFEAEGQTVRIDVPDSPRGAMEPLRRGERSVAVLPPPMCLELIGERAPVVLVANLLASDPINLVVRRGVAQQRGLDASAPLRERLLSLRGVRVGVAPNPPVRLRALFASAGLDADRDVEQVIVGGRDQNRAFAEGRVDALYAHTPYLETALVEQDAVLVVNQSAGEVPRLAGRQIHALVVTRALASGRPAQVQALVRAIARAERLIRADAQAAVGAILAVFPRMDRRKVETIVALYRPAIPASPRVNADGLRVAAELFPASRRAPDLAGIDLGAHVDDRFAAEAERSLSPPRRPPLLPAVGLALAALAAGAAWALRRRRRGRPGD